MGDNLARVVIQAGAEPGEGFQFLELGIGQLEVAGDGSVGGPLGGTADAGNGFADIHRRQHAEFKQ